MISYYKDLETIINMVESLSHDTKMEFSLDESRTLHTDLRPGINERGKPMLRETEYAVDKDTYKHLEFTQAARIEHTEMRVCLENFKGDKRIR